jgi:deoxyadenosine/deoxycytidine kinase
MTKTDIKNKAFFVVDGNIGAGKTTFLKILSEHLCAHVVYEPTTKWQKVIGTENLLENFYRDTPRWAYTFQSYAFVTRILEQETHAMEHAEPVQILERSVFSDRYCFAKNCYELGFMTELEWKLYQDWFSWLVDNYVIRPNGFIYLRVDPTICHQRLVKRQRHEETGVSLDYLQRLHQKHESWLVDKKDVASYVKDIPVLVLDCNEDFETSMDNQQKHMETVAQFVDQFMHITWKKTPFVSSHV